jgi:hypothetical protein
MLNKIHSAYNRMCVPHHEISDSQKTCDNSRYVTMLWRRTASHPLRDIGTGDNVTENTSNAVSQYCDDQSFEERKENSWSRNAFYTKFRSALGNGQWHMSLRCHYKLGVCRTGLKREVGKYLLRWLWGESNNKQPNRGNELHTLQHRGLEVYKPPTTSSLGHVPA